MIKQPSEDALVVVWVELDRVKDGCEDVLAVVLGVSDHRQALCPVAARLWVPPKQEERPYSAAIQRHSRYGR